MIIKINKKKHQIKLYKDLTIKEYREIVNAVAEKPTYSVFDYIAYQSGFTYDEMMLQNVTNLNLLQDELGDMLVISGDQKLKGVKTIEQLPLKKWITYQGKIIDLSNINIKSKVGYRVVIEQYMQSKPNYMQIYTFVMAVIIQERIKGNFDYGSIEQIMVDLDNQNAYNILGNGAFFLRNLVSGERKGWNYLKTRVRTLIKMRG